MASTICVSKYETYVIARDRGDGHMEIFTGPDGNIRTFRTRREALLSNQIVGMGTHSSGVPQPENAEFWTPYRMRLFPHERRVIYSGL